MFYIADLHLHSHYSRATSRDLDLESLYRWARIKGIHIVGTGDFTHPLWFRELKEKLEPDGTGFFRLKNPPKEDIPGFRCQDIDVRFCLMSEISSIYKQEERVRKNHNCIYAPDFETVARINAKLAQIGNLESDGRPILGLPSRDLLEIVLETSGDSHLIPAHIWTPWFSMLGSKSGYNSVEECFRDLAGHIFALETGLSSDPQMNWRLSMLDKYTLVSNSDAHSPQKLGREVNLFDTERSYYAMFNALKSRQGFSGTYEFFPEEGKYHMDGHRKCNVCFEPEESIKHKNICPECGQPLTIGVLHRVAELSDRKQSKKPEDAADFHYIIPLPEIIAEIQNVSSSCKAVEQSYQKIISCFGNEFTLLKQAPVEDIEKKAGFALAEAVKRMRASQVYPQGGYDGEFGVIKIFKKGELAQLTGQMSFFGMDASSVTVRRKSRDRAETETVKGALPVDTEIKKPVDVSDALNGEQSAACEAEGAVLVTAGPGTGKTKTLISWIVHCILKRNASPQEVLAVTFTNKAADEMKERLAGTLGERSKGITAGTFHSICFSILQERYKALDKVYNDESRGVILSMLFPDKEEKEIKRLSAELKDYFESGQAESPAVPAETERIAAAYRNFTLQNGGIDLADIIGSVVRMWKAEPQWLQACRERYNYIAVDELQDINPLQYEFLKLLATGKNLFAIGDPDQSIYCFRGADIGLFFSFSKDFNARKIALKYNYRSLGFIVEAAQNVILNNSLREDIQLVPNKKCNGKISLFTAEDEYKEAGFITSEIERLVGGFNNLSGGNTFQDSNYGFSDIAVLFRTRAVGKALLACFRQAGIPVRFGDASSFLSDYPFHLIPDAIKLYLNPGDMIALDSLLTCGFKMDKQQKRQFLFSHPEDKRFTALFGGQDFAKEGAEDTVKFIFEKFIPGDSLDDAGLLKKEAITDIAKEYGADIEQFLQKLLLDSYTDVARLKSDAVSLLTFHASKGLEFPVLFIAGAEEGITPLLRKDTDIEEERRLFYVALTRAKENLLITQALQRTAYKETENKTLSRFVKEISTGLIEHREQKRAEHNKPEQLRLF